MRPIEKPVGAAFGKPPASVTEKSAERIAPSAPVQPAPEPVQTAPAGEPKVKPELPKQEIPFVPAIPSAQQTLELPDQQTIEEPKLIPWRIVGEVFHTYIICEDAESCLWLIDKHAAHERILFEKLKANQETISSQSLLTPIPCRLSPDACAILMANTTLLEELGFDAEEFGENTLLLRQIPMDLGTEQAAETLEQMAADLLNGRREKKDSVRDEILHTVACKAAIKAGWHSNEKELLVLVEQVMGREDLKHCPHGRPICITLSKKQLEKQFKRA